VTGHITKGEKKKKKEITTKEKITWNDPKKRKEEVWVSGNANLLGAF